jgi:hypothetical protein
VHWRRAADESRLRTNYKKSITNHISQNLNDKPKLAESGKETRENGAKENGEKKSSNTDRMNQREWDRDRERERERERKDRDKNERERRNRPDRGETFYIQIF